MKWTEKTFRDGDLRTRRGFLFFPKQIGKQWRWLEFARWEERFQFHSYMIAGYLPVFDWAAIRWLPSPESERPALPGYRKCGVQIR